MTKRTLLLVLTALLVVGAVGAVPLSGLAQPVPAIDPGDAPHAVDEHDANGTAENASDARPGAMLSGVVGVQLAELDGEIERRSFGIRIARAASNESKADVVADELTGVEERIAALEQRTEELERARENGTIGNATYNAEMAELTARASTVRGLANQSETAAQGLPADLLESKGIDATAIRTLKQNASELTGPETAAVARSIAGPGVGQSLAGDRAPGLDDRTAGPDDSAAGPGNAPVDVGPDAKDETTTGNAPTDVGGDRSMGGGVDGGPGTGDDASEDEEETDTSSED